MILAWLLSVCAGIYIGYKYQSLEKTVNKIKTMLEARQIKKDEEVDSIVLDPDDEVQATQLEVQKRLRELNPDKDWFDKL